MQTKLDALYREYKQTTVQLASVDKQLETAQSDIRIARLRAQRDTIVAARESINRLIQIHEH